jgi:hypothetical protein
MTNEQINDAIAEAIQWKGIWRYRPNYCGDLRFALHKIADAVRYGFRHGGKAGGE